MSVVFVRPFGLRVSQDVGFRALSQRQLTRLKPSSTIQHVLGRPFTPCVARRRQRRGFLGVAATLTVREREREERGFLCFARDNAGGRLVYCARCSSFRASRGFSLALRVAGTVREIFTAVGISGKFGLWLDGTCRKVLMTGWWIPYCRCDQVLVCVFFSLSWKCFDRL